MYSTKAVSAKPGAPAIPRTPNPYYAPQKDILAPLRTMLRLFNSEYEVPIYNKGIQKGHYDQIRYTYEEAKDSFFNQMATNDFYTAVKNAMMKPGNPPTFISQKVIKPFPTTIASVDDEAMTWWIDNVLVDAIHKGNDDTLLGKPAYKFFIP